MKYFSTFFVCLSTYYAFASAVHGGNFVSIKELPYMAQIHLEFNTDDTSYCGAAIISEYWLASAAHCVEYNNLSKRQIRIGSSTTEDNGILIDIDQIIVHGDYETNSQLYDSDICLIKVKTPITFSSFAQPIKVSRKSPQPNNVITVAGFGNGHFDRQGRVLKMGKIPVISDEECKKTYDITKRMFCVYTPKIEFCDGDSGSPSTFNGELVGIISFGCSYNTKPNVLTKVAKYYDWIIKHTGIEYDD